MTKVACGNSARCVWLFAMAGLLGCPNAELAPIAPCTVSGVFDDITQGGNDEVDLLFVVDNSQSMSEEQANLAKRLPELVQSLASGVITNSNGEVTRRFNPVKSLHLGVVSSDMATSGVDETATLTNCGVDSKTPRPFGDDGILLNLADLTDGSCAQGADSYLTFVAGTDDPQALGAQFGCITRLGTNGCGFEQQLEAMWKALAPASDTSFSRGTAGHGDSKNAGFLRKDSVVAVIQVTDEEDCSIPDTARSLFDPKVQGKDLNVSCGLHPELLHPASRFIEGLKSLRPQNQDQVVFAAIAGIPVDAELLTTSTGEQDFAAILAHDDMQFRPVVGKNDNRFPEPACVFGEADAYPARRLVEVARGFGKNGIVRSICQDDFSGALGAIIDKIADQLQGACLERKLIADPETHLAPCGLVEYLPATKTSPTDCLPSKGRKFLEKRMLRESERVVCQLNQLAVNKQKAGCDAESPQHEANPVECLDPNPNSADDRDNPRVTGELVGWYYDDFSVALKSDDQCSAQRIAFTPGADQERGSEVRFECLQPVFSVFANPEGVDAVNKPCADEPTLCSEAQTEDYPSIICDGTRSTCQIECKESANCPDGWVCEASGTTKICLNPTCPPQ